jgi:hypothetical protein
MIALHKAMSPVTYSGTSGRTRVATASLIQLLPLVCKVMASLLATAPATNDNPTPAMIAELFMMTASTTDWIQEAGRDVGIISFVEGELLQGIICIQRI